MEVGSRFIRVSLMLRQQDPGYGAGQAPSGYVRIESRGNKGKLSAMVQNLKGEQDGLLYRLYIIKIIEKELIPACAGLIPVYGNKGTMEWSFDPDNVGMTGHPIEGFNAAAVLAEHVGEGNADMVCPLASFKEEISGEWREKLKKALKYQTHKDKEKPDGKTDETGIPISQDENGHAACETAPDLNTSLTTPIDGMKTINANGLDIEERKETSAHEDELDNLRQEAEIKAVDCDFKLKNFCPLTAAGNTSMCETCAIKGVSNSAQEEFKPSTSIEMLKENLSANFEKYDPFHVKRKDYRWWKINNPVKLSDILYQCGIRTPLIFNPSIMMAHFKYRHLIAGIYTDEIKHKQYFVCGVPGVYRIDPNPFGSMCRWANIEANKPKYGAFGYWLVYIDPQTGKFLDLS